MEPLFGHTRTRVAARHALIAPDGHVPSVIPGITNARSIALISPAMGAHFVQLHVTFQAGGKASFDSNSTQTFFFVTKGKCRFKAGKVTSSLDQGGYGFIPAGVEGRIESSKPGTEITVFQKAYVPLAGTNAPAPLAGHSRNIKGQPFLGNPDARLQVLLPDIPSFDMAVNVFTYQAGATLPFVETHIMEHGLVMLSGQGIYRLEDSWYPVREQDVIWMAPYCPQWFVAMGTSPASYLYYKDVNRQPL